MSQEFWLEPSSEEQLNFSPPQSRKWIYSAIPCVGVFESEQSFIEYLCRYHAPLYGDCVYKGIKGKPLTEPVKVFQKNYTIAISSNKPDAFSSKDLRTGIIAIVVSPEHYADHVVMKMPLFESDDDDNIALIDVTDCNCFTGHEAAEFTVRLLRPGETVTITGR